MDDIGRRIERHWQALDKIRRKVREAGGQGDRLEWLDKALHYLEIATYDQLGDDEGGQ